MTPLKTADALGILRKAVAFIVRRNDDVMEKWHDIDDKRSLQIDRWIC